MNNVSVLLRDGTSVSTTCHVDLEDEHGGPISLIASSEDEDQVKVPTLNIYGALDRRTPPEEASQSHTAPVENTAPSVLVNYPQEGYGVRTLPALNDFSTRAAGWFIDQVPAGQ